VDSKEFWKWNYRYCSLEPAYKAMYEAILENTTTHLWSVEPKDCVDGFLGEHYVHKVPEDEIALQLLEQKPELLGELETLCGKVAMMNKKGSERRSKEAAEVNKDTFELTQKINVAKREYRVQRGSSPPHKHIQPCHYNNVLKEVSLDSEGKLRIWVVATTDSVMQRSASYDKYKGILTTLSEGGCLSVNLCLPNIKFDHKVASRFSTNLSVLLGHLIIDGDGGESVCSVSFPRGPGRYTRWNESSMGVMDGFGLVMMSVSDGWRRREQYVDIPVALFDQNDEDRRIDAAREWEGHNAARFSAREDDRQGYKPPYKDDVVREAVMQKISDHMKEHYTYWEPADDSYR